MSEWVGSGAAFGDYVKGDSAYRYVLTREFEHGTPHDSILWIMLNPSTADQNVNDPTVRRCSNYSKLWGFKSMIVTNIFALRATNPKELRTHPDPIGPANDHTLRMELKRPRTKQVMIAWGSHGVLKNRDQEVLGLIRASDRIAMCLGVTKTGTPKHPLYLGRNEEPVLFPPLKAKGVRL